MSVQSNAGGEQVEWLIAGGRRSPRPLINATLRALKQQLAIFRNNSSAASASPSDP